MTTATHFNFKRPELLKPQNLDVVTKCETIKLKLERTPVVVRNAPYVPSKLVDLLNKLEFRGEVIHEVLMTDWKLSCRMDGDIVGVLAEGTDHLDLTEYVWYGREDVWQQDLNLDDQVDMLRRRHGNAINPVYLKEKCLQLEFTVKIVYLDR